MSKRKFAFIVLSLVFVTNLASAQTTPASEDDLFEMSLADLMDIEVVSASKKKENLFDAPVSASVLTKEEIKNSGVTSIMEAFRLIPGLIVREQSNGNYDVHIRGLDNVPPNSNFFNAVNTTTLVMIDSRPVYNYMQGGTFWASLPIDLNDVERIEVVRGAVSALYGPNAVSGVIQIITKRLGKKGLNASANAQAGNYNTVIGSGSLGYEFSDKFGINLSGNYQTRNRQQSTYYSITRNDWVPMDSLLKNYHERYPNINRAQEKLGINSNVYYAPKKDINFVLSGGLQESKMQAIVAENSLTPFSYAMFSSRHVDLTSNIKNLTSQLSYNGGTQGIVGINGNMYDYRTTDFTTEYNFNHKKLSIKPGVNYRNAVYDDHRFVDSEKKNGFLNGKKELTTLAAFVRAEYSLMKDKLRLIGGLRADKFTYPNGIHPSFQAAASYKPNDNHLFRFVIAKANRSPFIFDTYLNIKIDRPSPIPNTKIIADIQGSKNLQPLTLFNQELGYRAKLADNLQLDVEVYRSFIKNYTDLINQESRLPYKEGEQYVVEVPVIAENLIMSVRQLGGSISLNYVNKNFQLKPFLSYQDTHLFDYSEFVNTSKAPLNAGNYYQPKKYNTLTGVGTTRYHRGTPAVYGGAYMNYTFKKFNFNLNPYFYTSQTFYALANTKIRDGVRGIDHIKAKCLINAKVSYKVVSKLDMFVSVRNLLNDNAHEYYRTDKVGTTIFAGMNFEF